ncbi:hypothetical protein MDA_GLEAN10005179 [Myotis davidii]|uniref:Uncharacterized protein n=1 Tax=Myotis davidii TaxID=225400 RepID=L5LSU2_MYODS|nr:hypothetical protein MDA_GLEAN10005179 [Myotis davidii]
MVVIIVQKASQLICHRLLHNRKLRHALWLPGLQGSVPVPVRPASTLAAWVPGKRMQLRCRCCSS